MNIVFFGSSSYVLPIIEVLRKNFDLKLAITTEKSATDAVPTYCIENKIPYLSIQQFNNLTIKQLKIASAPVAILADFGLLIPQTILNLFPMGIINIHPSLLPKYRGPTPVQTAILNGEKITGISIIKLDEEIDHGPILAQEKEKILSTDTSETLYKRLFEKGANLLPKILDKYLNGNLKSTAQNDVKATFTKSLTRQDGYIDLSSLEIACPPASSSSQSQANQASVAGEVGRENCKLKIEQMVRAYFPWPGVWFKIELNGKQKTIKLLPNNLITQYSNDPFLIQVEGKRPMSYKDFLNGYPDAKSVMLQILPILK